MEMACLILDEKGNIVQIGHPECVMKNRNYWEDRGYRLEIMPREEALRMHEKGLKIHTEDDISGPV